MTSGLFHPSSPEDLRQCLAGLSDQPVRIIGGGTEQDRLPTPPPDAAQLSLAGMDRILRLDPEDQTATVEPGVTRAALDAALAEIGQCLPALGGSTVGGLFAADPIGSLAASAFCPRTLLLGVDGVLAEGLAFQAGAKVVKNVAGYDLPKVFVGSEGRLFIATALHLKLRPLPIATASFQLQGLDQEGMLTRFRRLRSSQDPPWRLGASREAGGWRLFGRFEGGTQQVERARKGHELPEGPEPTADDFRCHLPPAEPPAGPTADPDHGILRAALPTRQAEAFLAGIPGDAPVVLAGGGAAEAVLPKHSLPDAMNAVDQAGFRARITAGPKIMRGRCTPRPEAEEALEERVRNAFRPAQGQRAPFLV